MAINVNNKRSVGITKIPEKIWMPIYKGNVESETREFVIISGFQVGYSEREAIWIGKRIERAYGEMLGFKYSRVQEMNRSEGESVQVDFQHTPGTFGPYNVGFLDKEEDMNV